MKILIVGAGIIGSIYGWALSAAGHEVRHLVRKGRADRYQEGMSLDMLDLRKGQRRRFRGTYPIKAVEAFEEAEGYGLLIAPCHHFALKEVLEDIVPRLPRTDVIFLTQNWKGSAEIDAALSRDRYVFGDAKAGGSWRGDTLVGAIKSIDIGPVDSSGMPLASRLEACFESAAIGTAIHEEMLQYLWVQFAATGGLWPSLVKAGSFKAVLKDATLGREAFAAVQECLGLLEKRGLRLDDYPELSVYRGSSRVGRFLAMAMIRWMFTFSEWAKRTSSHALGDPREIRAFYYDLLESAKELGFAMPVFSGYKPYIDRFTSS
jgi:2-dehydropantoate 2-reductase